MLTSTSSPRQDSFRKFTHLVLVALLLCGCQTPKTSVVQVQKESIGKTFVPFVASQKGVLILPEPTPLPATEAANPAKPSAQNAAPLRLHRDLELPAQLPNCSITRLSKNVWRAIPKGNLGDSAASLMEDAIISSNIHARLKSSPVPWQYSSNAGVVTLNTPSLGRAQAISAIQAIVTIDKVSEVRLTTTLRE